MLFRPVDRDIIVTKIPDLRTTSVFFDISKVFNEDLIALLVGDLRRRNNRRRHSGGELLQG